MDFRFKLNCRNIKKQTLAPRKKKKKDLDVGMSDTQYEVKNLNTVSELLGIILEKSCFNPWCRLRGEGTTGLDNVSHFLSEFFSVPT